MGTVTIISIVAGAIILSAVLSAFYFTGRMHRKVTYMLDALEDKEMNFRFSDKKRGSRFNRILNRIRTIFDAERNEIAEQERYYGKMLDHIKTGIAVIDISPKGGGNVIYSNTAALDMLGISTFGNIKHLNIIDKDLEESFEKITDNSELRSSFYNERGKITVSIMAVSTVLEGRKVKIVAFNDISGEMAHNEELSWNRLIRVLTHEIMNTVTPIASLSDTLSEELGNADGNGNSSGGFENLDVNEFKTGLETIAASSKGLIKFVDAYRNLTRVSVPVKRAFYVGELIERVQQLVREEVSGAGAAFSYTEKSDDILLYADENQISQIIVNLIKNALQAGASAIKISAEIDSSQNVVIAISNNGRPIGKECFDEIFVPFYTTKQEGSGIGLSLSRQIMRLHNGAITLVRSDADVTTFCLTFK